MLLNEDSAAGTTGNKDIYQNFFVCLNYESRKNKNGQLNQGLYVQYGLQIDSDETLHLYLSYFDSQPLEPVYYSFGSRNTDVQILNAHIEPFNLIEQIKLRCKMSSTLNKAIERICDYECHYVCDGCTWPYSLNSCKRCAFAATLQNNTSINNLNGSLNQNISNIVCVEKCPNGYEPDLDDMNKLCNGNFI